MAGSRYMLKQDNDCHWYLVSAADWKLFDEMMEMDYSEWTTEGERWIESMRVDGPHLITFSDPIED